MKNQFFIPNKGDPYDSDDSSIFSADEIGPLDDPTTPESVSGDDSLSDSPDANDENQNDTDYSPDDTEDDDSCRNLLSSDEETKKGDVVNEELDNKKPKKESKMSLPLKSDSSTISEKGCQPKNSSTDDKEISTEDAGCSKQNDSPSTFKDDANCSDSDTDSSEDTDINIHDFFGVKPNQEAMKSRPPVYTAPCAILDICFHPEVDLIASATIDGNITICSYSLEEVKEISHLKHHQQSCRQVSYNENGTILYSISTDKSLAVVDMVTSQPKFHIKDAHPAPIYSFVEVDENQCATGDDDGTVKLWDVRTPKEVFSFNCSEETVTSLLYCDSRDTYLTATVADGSLTAFNVRTHTLNHSELFSSEFTCQTLVKQDSRLIVGTGEGDLLIFEWGKFGYPVESFKGHSDMITCLAPISENMIITGSDDGVLRGVHMYPHRYMGVLGQQPGFGVENVALSHCGSYFASCSKEIISFWFINFIYYRNVTDEKRKKRRRKSQNNIKKVQRLGHMPSSRQRNKTDFFRDFPTVVASDDEKGPVTGTGYESD